MGQREVLTVHTFSVLSSLEGSCDPPRKKSFYLPKRLGGGLFDHGSQFWNLELRAISIFRVLTMDQCSHSGMSNFALELTYFRQTRTDSWVSILAADCCSITIFLETNKLDTSKYEERILTVFILVAHILVLNGCALCATNLGRHQSCSPDLVKLGQMYPHNSQFWMWTAFTRKLKNNLISFGAAKMAVK